MGYLETKEFAKQMREQAVKDEYGRIVCSVELWELIAEIFDSLPTADVVEVVRCKDCKHFGKNKQYRETKLPISFCDKFHHNVMRDSDFCSYGKEVE